MVKSEIDSIEVHPQLSHNGHPASSGWCTSGMLVQSGCGCSRSLPYLEHTTERLKYEKFRNSLNLKDIKKTRPTQHKDGYPKTLAIRVLEN
jgi:hypothetical protein